MFHNVGKQNFIHNLRLATLLSFVAGIVNILETHCKTTNQCYFLPLQRKLLNKIMQ
jgi:hypothetical protein